MKNNSNVVLKALVILIFDVIAIASFIWWAKPTPSDAIIKLIYVPAIIVINLIVATMISFFGNGANSKALAIAFVINAFVAGFIFDRLFSLWYSYYHNKYFTDYSFTNNGKQYELNLDKRDTSYSILEIFSGSPVQYKAGKYELHKDSVVLKGSSKRLFLINNQLIGYPAADGRIPVVLK